MDLFSLFQSVILRKVNLLKIMCRLPKFTQHDFFFCSGVKTDILNEKKQAAIHLVTELNKVAVLEVMGRHKDKIDIQQGGEHGRTALHIAAIYDHEECARTLVSEKYY